NVKILGKSIKSDYKRAVREVGAIVENPEMYTFMTGLQNLQHYARMIPNVTNERIDEVIKLIGLEKPIKEKVGKYSLGMRQRLGIAQALLRSEEHTSELQSRFDLVCRLLLEKKK